MKKIAALLNLDPLLSFRIQVNHPPQIRTLIHDVIDTLVGQKRNAGVPVAMKVGNNPVPVGQEFAIRLASTRQIFHLIYCLQSHAHLNVIPVGTEVLQLKEGTDSVWVSIRRQ